MFIRAARLPPPPLPPPPRLGPRPQLRAPDLSGHRKPHISVGTAEPPRRVPGVR